MENKFSHDEADIMHDLSLTATVNGRMGKIRNPQKLFGVH